MELGREGFAHRRRSRRKTWRYPLHRAANRFETYFLNTLDDAARLVHEVGSPNVKIHFDTFHSNIEEKHQAEALRAVAKDLGHVHISENDRGIPGNRARRLEGHSQSAEGNWLRRLADHRIVCPTGARAGRRRRHLARSGALGR